MTPHSSCKTSHLNEYERSDEDVGSLDVLLEGGNVLRVAQLLQQVTDALHAHVVPAVVDRLARLRQGALVLRLQHHVRYLARGRKAEREARRGAGREGGKTRRRVIRIFHKNDPKEAQKKAYSYVRSTGV